MNHDLLPIEGFKPLSLSSLSDPPKRIQYACGLNVLPGWLNVDFIDDALMWNFQHIGGVPRNFSENVYKVNLLEPHPFPDNHFEFAFCEDFIEHVDQKNAILFLSEVLRTLKPGGVLRLTTPGLEGVMERHFRNADYAHVVANHASAYTQWGHLHFFSQASLRTVALGLGFSQCQASAFHSSDHGALKGLETRPEQASMNLYAELTK